MREVPYTLKINSHSRFGYNGIDAHEITIGPGRDIDLPYYPGVKEISVDIYIIEYAYLGAPETRYPTFNVRFQPIAGEPHPLIYGTVAPGYILNISKNIDIYEGHVGHINFQASTTWNVSDEAMKIVIPALGTSWTDHYANTVFGVVVKVKPDVHFIGF